MALLERTNFNSALIFSRTKHGADRIAHKLKQGNHSVAVLHSNRTQRERIEALEGFKSGKYEVMVATDIAARGLDIAGVSHVINYDVPEHAEDYVHRIGRTGRAQNVGDAFTLMNGEEVAALQAIERFIGRKIPRLKLENFPYLYTVLFEPESATGGRRAIGGGRSHRGYSYGRRRRLIDSVFFRAGDQLECGHGNNRDNQERSLHREGRSGIDRRRRKQVSRGKTNGALPLRCLDGKTVLRRHPFQNRFPSGRESRARIQRMKTRVFVCLCTLFAVTSARAEKIALVNGTLINPMTEVILPGAHVLIDNGRVVGFGDEITFDLPKDARKIDCKGKFILPGYIDTHIQFFQYGDLFTRPDAADLNSVRLYKDEVAWVKSHVNDVLARYLRCGITSVVDVGGPFWNFEVRKTANATAKAPRVAVAGPLISSVSREKLDLGDPPIVKIDSPDQARAFVRKLAEQKPDLVKIWYIVDKEHPVESFRPIVRATIEESHAHKIRVAVHATELDTARAAVEEGADVLVHSVTDKPIDDAFVKLLKDRHTILCPTLVVFERYGRTFSHQLNLTPEEKAWGNPEVIASLDVTKIPQDKLPDRIKNALANQNDASILT